MEDRKKFIKEALKEAFKEYMDEKIQSFGKWSLRTLAAAIIMALLYFLLTINGWQHIPSSTSAHEVHK